MSHNNEIKLLIATGIYPPDIGGPATMLKSLAEVLGINGVKVNIITYSSVKGLAGEAHVHRVIKKRFLSRPAYFLKMLLLALASDLVYVTDTYSVGWFAYVIKKLTGKKYLVRFAGDSAWETSVGNGWTDDYIVDFQNKVYNAKIEKLKDRRRKIMINADTIIAVSRFIGGVAELIGVSKDKIKTIYNSIDFIEPSNSEERPDRSRLGMNSTDKVIVTACRLTPWKGVDGIIRILPELNRKFGKVFFLVLGDGPELINLQKLAADNNVSDRVKFLGKVSHDSVIDYFKLADVFVLNTNYEALSHTLLEAMKAEVPIVATNIGGNPEVIENERSGLLVGYNNQPELSSAISRILSDQGLSQELVNNAREKLKMFSWDNTVQGTVQAIKQLL